ncbi:MAG: hypothetical protein IFK92_03500 [Acidobacteria bacterium]|nr:hypothetical protein [Candidatus Sulfomarinibacter kjeldsenii]
MRARANPLLTGAQLTENDCNPTGIGSLVTWAHPWSTANDVLVEVPLGAKVAQLSAMKDVETCIPPATDITWLTMVKLALLAASASTSAGVATRRQRIAKMRVVSFMAAVVRLAR